MSAWQELEPSGRSSCWPEMPFEAEGQRSWCFCLFLPSNLMPDRPRGQGPGNGGQTDPVGAGNRGKTKEGSKQGTDQQRGLSVREDVKVSKYWLLLTDQ